jgi:hypothetical protein
VPERIGPVDDSRGVETFHFEVVGGRAREVEWHRAKARNRYQFAVQILLGNINGRIRCIGVELRSYESIDPTESVWMGIKPFDHRDGFTEINSALWRSIPIGDLIERAIANQKGDYTLIAEWHRNQGEEVAASVYESLAAEAEVPDRPQRGPKRLLSLDDLTQVVKPAYLTGGRRPVVAVRDAMSKHRGQSVTMDQARKAVVRAREAGILPPAGGRGKP